MPPQPRRKSALAPSNFELHSQTGELFKEGHRINLHGQPIEVLTILLKRPSELVTREELRAVRPADIQVPSRVAEQL